MNSFDDQYDAPLSGPERVRLRALEMITETKPFVDGSPTERAEQWVELARAFERYIIGNRAAGVQERLDEAFLLAQRLLQKGVDATGTDDIVVDVASMRELVKMLSGLAEMPF